MWFVVILIVTVALILGPMMMLKPNPAQKRREGMRMQARELGLRFMMRALPKLNTDIDAPMPMPVYYLPPKTLGEDCCDWTLMRTAYTHEGNVYRDWDWQGSGRPESPVENILKTYLPDLSQGVRAITAGHQGICIYWDEKGQDNLVPLIARLLTELQRATEPQQASS